MIENWYQSNCNNDWEHAYGIKNSNCNFPGWVIEIDLANTSFENLERKYKLTEVNQDEWYGIEIKNGIYKASGYPKRLKFLLEEFRNYNE
jgi:hypothetical protein